jgi:hypothetical protein
MRRRIRRPAGSPAASCACFLLPSAPRVLCALLSPCEAAPALAWQYWYCSVCCGPRAGERSQPCHGQSAIGQSILAPTHQQSSVDSRRVTGLGTCDALASRPTRPRSTALLQRRNRPPPARRRTGGARRQHARARPSGREASERGANRQSIGAKHYLRISNEGPNCTMEPLSPVTLGTEQS